jgi:hypothetical protein
MHISDYKRGGIWLAKAAKHTIDNIEHKRPVLTTGIKHEYIIELRLEAWGSQRRETCKNNREAQFPFAALRFFFWAIYFFSFFVI